MAPGDTTGRLDLDAVLARNPQIALVDELVHRNPPGPGHATRWQDAAELLAAGIDVISTVSIGQLDSVGDVVEKITGVPAGLTVPDPVVRAADEIELVDVTPEALHDRLAHDLSYPPGPAGTAQVGWPGAGPVSALRQLALRWLAATLAQHHQRGGPSGHGHQAEPGRERVVAALPGGAQDQTLIRRAARIAVRCGADLMAVHVTCPGGPAAAVSGALVAQRRLTESLGGTYHQLISHDVAAALLTFAHTDNATQLVLGTRHCAGLTLLRAPWRPSGQITSRVIRECAGTDVHIVTRTAERNVAASRRVPC